jgi:hypothetical protein
MIQLATDPHASRPNWRQSLEAEGRHNAAEPLRRREAHPWPFISKQADRPVAQAHPRAAGWSRVHDPVAGWRKFA